MGKRKDLRRELAAATLHLHLVRDAAWRATEEWYRTRAVSRDTMVALRREVNLADHSDK